MQNRSDVAPGEVRRHELKFQRLADDLRRGILDGTWPVGSKLPTDHALAAQTGFSLTTVRRAYDELTEQGLIERRQGAGTFVMEAKVAATSGLSVGVLIPDTTAYFPRVLQGIERALAAAGARMTLACSHYEHDVEEPAIRGMLDGGVDGLLVVPVLHTVADPAATIRWLQELPVPVVLVERRLPALGCGDDTFHVCTDHAGGAYDAVRHLSALGHEGVALVSRSGGPTADDVRIGWTRARADLGLSDAPEIRHPIGDWSPKLAEEAVAALRDAGATAVLSFGDRESVTIVAAARRLGVDVPGDLAIVSYDDELADLAEVPLTAVAPPKYRLGHMAAELLLNRVVQGEAYPPHQVLLRPRLVIRSSCGVDR